MQFVKDAICENPQQILPLLKIKDLWKKLTVSPDESHHLLDGRPAYSKRFLKVLKFHLPGYAPAHDDTGAFHIDVEGNNIYPQRYLRTFGFYDSLAAVSSIQGWFHLKTNGKPLYSERYSWTGNYQEKLCTVRNSQGSYFHIDYRGKKSYQEFYRFAGDFRDGYAVVQNHEGLSTHINREGKFLHNRWLVDLDVFHKGFARAKDEKGWFHIDPSGKGLYSTRFEAIEPFYNGYARVETADGAILIIDERGLVSHNLRSPQSDSFHAASAKLVSYWGLYTLHCASDLKIFDQLPSSPMAIARQLNFPLDSVIRLLRALQEMGLVINENEERYLLTETGSYFTTHHDYSLANALQFWKEEHYASWQNLHYSLQTGCSAFEKEHSISWFSWLRNHADKNILFHDVMETYARRDYQKISSLLNMDNHTTVLDIGGSTGSLLIQLLNDNPHLNGILLDLPEIMDHIEFKPLIKNRISLIKQDFFEPWPPFKSDAIFLSRILHDWSDSQALALLHKARSCLADSPQSTIYIVENLLNTNTGAGGLLDLNMLIMTQGKERSLDQYKELLAKADLNITQQLPLNEVTYILFAKKKQ